MMMMTMMMIIISAEYRYGNRTGIFTGIFDRTGMCCDRYVYRKFWPNRERIVGHQINWQPKTFLIQQKNQIVYNTVFIWAKITTEEEIEKINLITRLESTSGASVKIEFVTLSVVKKKDKNHQLL